MLANDGLLAQMRFGMSLDDSRVIVLDVVASAISGIPVCYPVPPAMADDTNLIPIDHGSAPSGFASLQRVWTGLRAQLALRA
ncbi:hypothetical protein [Rhodopseudomonas sp. B29]|uniref:hypothetical protein n=1 Tax=Rhodopseudomonas sp. B29 TaxID=95607 RepID=UPI00034BB15F|nr:hypothetical protein [Rhodopseudomonas sp. B29]